MCGFAGEFIFQDSLAEFDVVRAMADRLAHRGPDEQGEWLSPEKRCALASRRLAVIDPPRSHQPMTDADGRLAVAFNGEIYNFPELRDELAADGVELRTASDTEVLLHLYRRHGPGMLDKLQGMFAFAIYDSLQRSLLLARDRLGQKPLWYAFGIDRVIFASEAKALLAHPDIRGDLRRISITSYLTIGYVPAPETIWSDILKLPPAHCLAVTERPTRPRRYWHCQAVQIPSDPAQQIEMIRERLRSSVRARLVSDVPLGALLSGGLDSAIIVALMSEAAGDAGGVKTFTAGFADDAYDERPVARQLALHCKTDHTELLVEPDPAGALDRIVEMYDEPFADSSALPMHLICQAARRHVTVALAGDGGDEVFGGYDRYRALMLAGRMRPLRYALTRLAAALARPFARRSERSRLTRFLRFADALPLPAAMQYFRYRSLFDADDLQFLLADEFAESLDLHEPTRWFCELYESGDAPDEVVRGQRSDLATYLPDDLLVKADIASMASGLELRAPMLDPDVVQLGLSLPLEAKLSASRGKVLLRAAVADLLPREIVDQPKRGFGVPLARWLRGELREEMKATLLDRSPATTGIFRGEAIEGLINDHLAGKRDYAHRLWALMVLARWLARNGP